MRSPSLNHGQPRIHTMFQHPRPFPAQCFLVVLIAAVALYLVLGALVWATNRQTLEFRDHALDLDRKLDDIRLQASGMAAQALLAAATGEQGLASSHAALGARLAADMAGLQVHAKNHGHVPGYDRLERLVGQIGAVQDEALALALTAGNTAAAGARLRSPDYERAQQALFEELDRLDAVIKTWAEAMLATQARYTEAALWCIAVFTPVFVFLSLLLLRSAMRHIRSNHEAQLALAASEGRFRATFELAAVGIAHVSLDGAFLRINDQFCAITGYDRETLSRLTFAAITHPDDQVLDTGQLDRLLAGTVPTYALDKRYIRKDGSEIWAALTVSLVRDQAGKPDYCIGVIEDITERKLAEGAMLESARTVEALLDATTDRVILADREGRVLAINAAGVRGLGRPLTAILGKTFFELFPEEVAAGRLEVLQQAMATGQSLRFSDERAGIVFDHIVTPLPDAAGIPRGAALFARDVTDIVRAREAAEAANRAKSEFLANISHEIRTPLNGILGMAQILAGAEPSQDQRQCLDDIQSASEGLLALVTHILELSRLEAGLEAPDRTPFVLGSILQAVEAWHGRRARDKGLAFTMAVADDVPPLLLGDGDRLRRVLEHLLANTVKFTEAGEIAVTVTRQETRPPLDRDDNGVALLFAVRDTGIGITSQDQARIFESFAQADGSATRRYGGSGLGLTIASRLVEDLDGSIRVESAPGQGSVFFFTLRFELPGTEIDL